MHLFPLTFDMTSTDTNMISRNVFIKNYRHSKSLYFKFAIHDPRTSNSLNSISITMHSHVRFRIAQEALHSMHTLSMYLFSCAMRIVGIYN